MDIVIGNLIGLAIIVFLFWKFVRPVLSKAVTAQKEAIAEQVTESEAAKARVADAQAAHERALAEAKAEAEELHKGAVRDAENIKQDLVAQIESEVKRITEHGRSQTELNRASLVRSLRNDLGLTAIDGGASKLVRSHLADSKAQSESIDRVIEELESMSAGGPSDLVTRSVDLIGLHSMRATSREAALAVSSAFDSSASSLDSDALVKASDELTEVIRLLDTNPVLRKRLTEDEDNTTGQVKLVENLFGGKVSPIVVEVLSAAVKQRWSSSADFSAALRRQNALIVLAASERDGVIEQTENELFSVARLIDQNPQLASLLSDHSHDGGKRAELLRSLVGGEGRETVLDPAGPLRRTATGPAGRCGFRSARRAGGGTPWRVRGPRGLGSPPGVGVPDHASGLRARHHLRTHHLGADRDRSRHPRRLRISVGDEVIEADVATRLAKAAESLPS